jgi:hypothetical protein
MAAQPERKFRCLKPTCLTLATDRTLCDFGKLPAAQQRQYGRVNHSGAGAPKEDSEEVGTAARKQANLVKGAQPCCDGTPADKRQPPEWFTLLALPIGKHVFDDILTWATM